MVSVDLVLDLWIVSAGNWANYWKICSIASANEKDGPALSALTSQVHLFIQALGGRQYWTETSPGPNDISPDSRRY